MQNNKQRGEMIRLQILRDVKHHPKDIANHIATIFSITPQATHSHLKRLETGGWIETKGRGRGKTYFLGEKREYKQIFELKDNFAEDRIWSEHYAFVFEGLTENVVDICHYGFTEMVNNVIDHSDGKTIYISVKRDEQNITIFIMDDGEGIFRRIKRLCDLADDRQALVELSKGKLTTDPENHSGEGIFFTSRVFDLFEIDSKGLKFSHQDDYTLDFLIDSDFMLDERGTMVYMKISRNSERTIKEVFETYSSGPDDFQFNRTVIPVKLAIYDDEKLVSRSQAKRLLRRVEKFSYVIFDFEDVSSVGQAFADEIFRVYANRHKDINLIPVKMNEDVSMMVNRAVSKN